MSMNFEAKKPLKEGIVPPKPAKPEKGIVKIGGLVPPSPVKPPPKGKDRK